MSRMGLATLLWLIGRNDRNGFLEVRRRNGPTMRASFHEPRDRHTATYITAHGKSGDVFIGAAPRRTSTGGGKSNIERVWCLWADCDDDASVDALATFKPAPSFVVATGSGNNVQAWWPLAHWLEPAQAEQLNRRIAYVIGSDMRATDSARILRPPGTFNHKHDPPAPVRCIANVPGFPDITPLLKLPDPPREPNREKATSGAVRPADGTRGDTRPDDLLAIPATSYVPQLTGREVSRTGHVRCPFHKGGKERTPSLKVYDDPARGWYCYGCEEGGSIYDFAARLWGMATNGEDFPRLRERLREEVHA